MRRLMVMLLTVALCLLSVAPALTQGQYATIEEYEKATGKRITKFEEVPALRVKVAAGELPPVKERLSEEPMVVIPVEKIGQYGGTWHRVDIRAVTAAASRINYEPIVRWARDGKTIVPNVAKKWEISENGKVFTFYLRKGMKWSDGHPFTAEDILFWYQDILLNKELTPVFPRWLTTAGNPVKVEKIDDYTVRFRFTQPYGLFLQYATQNGEFWHPKHYLKNFHPKYVPKEKIEKLAKKEGFTYWYQLFPNLDDFRKNPELPTIRNWKVKVPPPATRVIYERNPYYWKVDPSGKQLPYIDRITYDLVEDVEMANMKAVMGEVDMQLRHMSFTNYPLFMENREKGGYRVLKWKAGESGATAFLNQTLKGDPVLRELIQNRKFRTALSLAINREEINELIYLGMAEPVEGVLLPESLWDNKELLEPYTYNPEKAKKLLDEIGLKWDKDHKYRLRPDGKVLSLTIEVLTAFPTLVDAFDLVRSYWEAIGIKTAVKPLSYDIWWPRIYSSEYQVAGYLMTRVGWLTYARDYVPNDRSTYWGPLYGLWYISGGKSGIEPTGDARKVQEIYDEIRKTVDEEKRKHLSEEILRIACENIWSIPTAGFYPQPVIVKKSFRNVPQEGINSWPLRTPGYTNPEQYFIEQK